MKKTATLFKNNICLILLFFIVTIHVIILLNLNFFPYPELFVYSFLKTKGLIPYKDIFDQHFPGIMFLPINLYSLGLATFTNTRLIQLVLVVFNQILLFKIGKRILKSSKKALFINVIYLIWQPYFEGYVLWIESFVTPILLLSYYFLNEKRDNYLFLSGLLMGLALIFKQVVAPLAITVVFYLILIKKIKNKISYYLTGLAIFPSLVFLYVLMKGILGEFIYWTISFNLTVFSEMGLKKPDLSGIIQAAPLFAIGFLSMVLLFLKYKKLYLLLTLYALLSLLFAYARYDFIHLQPAIPFFILLMGISYFKLKPRLRLFILTVYLILSAGFIVRFYKYNYGHGILFYKTKERLVAEIVSENTTKEDKIFSYATMPNIYYLTDRLPPGNKFVFQFPWFMKVAEGDILKGIIQDPPELVIQEKGVTVQGYGLDDYMKDIDKYIELNYKVINKIDEVNILKKI